MNIKTKWNFQLPYEFSGNKQKMEVVIRHVPKHLEKNGGVGKWRHPVFHIYNFPAEHPFQKRWSS